MIEKTDIKAMYSELGVLNEKIKTAVKKVNYYNKVVMRAARPSEQMFTDLNDAKKSLKVLQINHSYLQRELEFIN